MLGNEAEVDAMGFVKSEEEQDVLKKHIFTRIKRNIYFLPYTTSPCL